MSRLPNCTPVVQDQQGLTTVEYIIVLGLIAVFGIAAWTTFGERLSREVGEGEKSMDVVSAGSG